MRHPEFLDGNLFDSLPKSLDAEEFRTLVASGTMRLSRIVSMGQAGAVGEWLDQTDHEWVVLLKGRAAIKFDGEAHDRVLEPGDFLLIPAHARHRVQWTAPGEPTVWLALHYSGPLEVSADSDPHR
jgi:cupin 2 domain-containing protein